MKLARTIAVLTVIVVFPAMSWYYLNRGAAWRIAGLDAMREKITLEVPNSLLMDDDGEVVAGLGTDFVIAVNVDPNKEVTDLNKIAELFSHRGDVLLLSFNGRSSDLNAAWTVLDCGVSPCDEWSAQLFSETSNAALIDDSLYLRNTYDLNVEGQIKLLAEHGVILFPVEKSKKIKLKRGENE